jgi:small-conductance mechanosensitive channel
VVRQTVDIVELRDLNSITSSMPSAEYYQAGYANLSRAEKFRVVTVFGIDYATQSENVADIEKAFKDGVQESLNDTPYAESIVRLNVDFHSAGDSSLNYQVMAEFKPEAARYHNRIKRRLQRACVMVCNEQGWGIPFPQVTVHLPDSETKTSSDSQ